MWIRLKDSETAEKCFYNTETEEKSAQRPKEGFRLYHILIKHEKSRKPVDFPVKEAFKKAESIYNDLKSKINKEDFRSTFMQAASRYSQCSSSKRGGDLGFVCGNEMVKEFEEPAFLLKRGGIVGPVSTPSGFHIIYRR